MVFAPDGKTLAIGTGFPLNTNTGPPDAEVWIFDVARRERVCPPIQVGETRARPYRFSKDGTILYTKSLGGKTLRLWDARTGKSLGRDVAGGPDTTDMAVSQDDRIVFQSDRGGRVTRREIEGGEPIGKPWLLQSQRLNGLLVNPDGHTFLTVSIRRHGSTLGHRIRSAAGTAHRTRLAGHAP